MKRWLKRLSLICLAAPLPVLAQAWDIYAGVHGGVDGYEVGYNELNIGFLKHGKAPSAQAATSYGTAGAQIGLDCISGHKLFGAVADWDWAFSQSVDLIKFKSTHEIDRHLRWFSTYRGRGGLLWCEVLVYLTGGAVLADFKTKIVHPHEDYSFRRQRWGWVAGLGTEFPLWRRLTLNAEFLFLHFDNVTQNVYSRRLKEKFSFDFTDNIYVGRLGLNCHFSLCNF